MSTRCTISVIDSEDGFTIYRHSDGDPQAVLPDLYKALDHAWPFPRFEADEFAAAIVAAMKRGPGGIRLVPGGHGEVGDSQFQYTVYSRTKPGESEVMLRVEGVAINMDDSGGEEARAREELADGPFMEVIGMEKLTGS